MDFSFTDEQKMLADSVERFVQDEYDFDTRKAITRSDEGFRRDYWEKFAELGWLALPFAEEDGGLAGVHLALLTPTPRARGRPRRRRAARGRPRPPRRRAARRP